MWLTILCHAAVVIVVTLPFAYLSLMAYLDERRKRNAKQKDS